MWRELNASEAEHSNLRHSLYLDDLLMCSLSKRTRADELQESGEAVDKSKVYYKNSLYMQLGKVLSHEHVLS